MAGLMDALREIDQLFDGRALHVPTGYYQPGYVAVLAAYAKRFDINQGNIHFNGDKNQGYCSAVGLSLALWNVDDYPHDRINSGANYSLLTHLSAVCSVDDATGQINGCIRDLSGEYAQSPGVALLMDVVGELHDNVWSHGKNSGFSIAQKRAAGAEDWLLEFALADCGMGFLAELKSTGMHCDDHGDAIDWCIQEGNSTKLGSDIDEWAQRLPADHDGCSPYGEDVDTYDNDNFHQGLGLARLIELVKTYSGSLYLCSGDKALEIDYDGSHSFETIPPWSGVALSCTFRKSELCKPVVAVQDPAIDTLMDQLRI
jgi:hypothetical protein